MTAPRTRQPTETRQTEIIEAVLDLAARGNPADITTADIAEFWIQLHGRFLHIRYFAVRDVGGAYLGCLEMTQDVTAIRALDGERRLLAEAAGGGR